MNLAVRSRWGRGWPARSTSGWQVGRARRPVGSLLPSLIGNARLPDDRAEDGVLELNLEVPTLRVRLRFQVLDLALVGLRLRRLFLRHRSSWGHRHWVPTPDGDVRVRDWTRNWRGLHARRRDRAG